MLAINSDNIGLCIKPAKFNFFKMLETKHVIKIPLVFREQENSTRPYVTNQSNLPKSKMKLYIFYTSFTFCKSVRL